MKIEVISNDLNPLPSQTEAIRSTINYFEALVSELPNDAKEKDRLLGFVKDLHSSIGKSCELVLNEPALAFNTRLLFLELKKKTLVEKIETIKDSIRNFYDFVMPHLITQIYDFDSYVLFLCQSIEEIETGIIEHNVEVASLSNVMSEKE